MNLYDLQEATKAAINSIDEKLAGLSYAQINSLLESVSHWTTIENTLMRDRLEVAKGLIEQDYN